MHPKQQPKIENPVISSQIRKHVWKLYMKLKSDYPGNIWKVLSSILFRRKGLHIDASDLKTACWNYVVCNSNIIYLIISRNQNSY